MHISNTKLYILQAMLIMMQMWTKQLKTLVMNKPLASEAKQLASPEEEEDQELEVKEGRKQSEVRWLLR